MPRRSHTGSRLRERRTVLALKQADLARQVGISPAYLNLIEHNRRRIGGKLLVDLARALGVDPTALSEGAEIALIERLNDAAARRRPEAPEPETDRIEEFAARFPGWAALNADQHARITRLERTVEALTDRLTHDPYLSASLHEVLSSVTSIRSTAGILAGGEEIEPEWLARFHRNLYEDSRRLAEASQALVSYLDEGSGEDAEASTPQDEVESWLAASGFHIPALEADGQGGAAADVADMIAAAQTLRSAPARQLAQDWLRRYARDAQRMPARDMAQALEVLGADPAKLAERFGVSIPAAMRRLGALPVPEGQPRPFGVVICDGSGTLTFRQPIEGFALPKYGAACPLWPLYQALARPGVPIRTDVVQPGPTPMRFSVHAICVARGPLRFDLPPILEASMLIAPSSDQGPAIPVGTSCRICPRGDCPARREPSILTEGL